jgi:hypothetical protein
MELREALLTGMETIVRVGDQLGALPGLDIAHQQAWSAQAQLFVNIFRGNTKAQEKLQELLWRKPINTDTDRAAQVRQDAGAIREVLAILRADRVESDRRLACDDVAHLLNSFEGIYRRLQRRSHDRPPLTIKDEYDVHYLLQALLTTEFSDVRSEEAVASVAGANSRIDFFLKPEKIAIEVKAPHSHLSDLELGQQLLHDLARYKAHTGVQTLFFFIWDPDHYIRNPAGLRNDVQQEAADRSVHVIFSPPRK